MLNGATAGEWGRVEQVARTVDTTIAIRCRFANWIMRYDAAIVFDIDIQVRTRNHAASELQDFRKAV